MKALSIRSPWWWYILHAGKDIENRDWPTRYRGPVLIHASKWWRRMDVWDDVFDVQHLMAGRDDFTTPCGNFLRDGMSKIGGHIVGVAEIVDCVTSSDSPWFAGPYGFKLASVSAFKVPFPCKGALGLFEVPDDFVGHPERA